MTTLFMAALSLLAQVAVSGPTPIDVTRVSHTEELTVTMESDGCFHSGRYEFFFRFSAGGAEVEVSEWQVKQKKWRFLHRRDLAAKHLKQIQQSLAHYRTPQRGGCTTVERFRFDLTEGGLPKASETYIDDSCASLNKASLFQWSGLL